MDHFFNSSWEYAMGILAGVVAGIIVILIIAAVCVVLLFIFYIGPLLISDAYKQRKQRRDFNARENAANAAADAEGPEDPSWR